MQITLAKGDFPPWRSSELQNESTGSISLYKVNTHEIASNRASNSCYISRLSLWLCRSILRLYVTVLALSTCPSTQYGLTSEYLDMETEERSSLVSLYIYVGCSVDSPRHSVWCYIRMAGLDRRLWFWYPNLPVVSCNKPFSVLDWRLSVVF